MNDAIRLMLFVGAGLVAGWTIRQLVATYGGDS